MKNKSNSDECLDLIEHHNCIYYSNHEELMKSNKIHPGGELEVWDIEDLNNLGTEMKACPYYASKELMPLGQLIFCPYNYLIDPIIRVNEYF
jgi:fanconi anemia group J protein